MPSRTQQHHRSLALVPAAALTTAGLIAFALSAVWGRRLGVLVLAAILVVLAVALAGTVSLAGPGRRARPRHRGSHRIRPVPPDSDPDWAEPRRDRSATHDRWRAEFLAQLRTVR
jgi:hypothetical protein